jgi:soluble lytic murein transglycosylase-like protein
MNDSPRALAANHPVMARLLGLAVLLLTIVHVADGRPGVAIDTAAPSIDSHIKEAAARYAVSEDLVAAVIEVESQFNPRAVSHRGAQGLMQLMPATAASLGVRDPFDPRENIHGGVRHLRWLMDRFDHDVPVVLAAYNAGEHAVVKNRGVPPSRETRDYVRRVMRGMNRRAARS